MKKQTQCQLREAVDVPTAARLLHVHPLTVRRWIAAGDLPAHRVGASRRFIRIYVDDLVTVADTGPVTG
jgi:excisionase family DNA binding protein